jgi:DNA replication factor GINS
MHLEDLRGILLSERDSGTLIQIPHDLYQTTATLMRTLQQEVIIMDDPFSDEARLLIEKVASIRATAEELFQIRSEKIVSLAQSQADGSYIDRDALRILIPAELEMFNRVVDGIRACRVALIEWRMGGLRSHSPSRQDISERTAPSTQEYALVPPTFSERELTRSDTLGEDAKRFDNEPITDHTERAYEESEGWTPSDEEDDEPFPYSLVQVKANMEPFMGVDGRTYQLSAGDIITIPRRNAEVLAERDIVLNINPG